jgi:dynein heavy chain
MATKKLQQSNCAQEDSNEVFDNLIQRDTRQRIKELEVVVQSPEIAWIRQQMKVIRGDWAWSTAHSLIALGFLDSNINGRLFAYQDKNARLQLSTMFPKEWEEVLILLKDPSTLVTMLNIEKSIQCQLLRNSPSDSLLRILQGIYVPFIFDNELSQVNVTKDFEEDFYKFMATLTESIYEAKGQTLLYLPSIEYQGSLKDQVQNKELPQRLEQAINRWIRQIKDVIRIKEEYEENEVIGPLAEINFWHQRNQNLTGIFFQIQQQGHQVQLHYSKR